jgi:hypothetical protein
MSQPNASSAKPPPDVTYKVASPDYHMRSAVHLCGSLGNPNEERLPAPVARQAATVTVGPFLRTRVGNIKGQPTLFFLVNRDLHC